VNSFDLIQEIAQLFRQGGMESPDLEARHLVAAAENEMQARDWAARRLKGEPLAYLTGTKGFYKYEFAVAAGVLIPRPESEHVVEVALKRKPGAKTIADLGAGSGCIGLSLVSELEDAHLWSVDASDRACQTVSLNSIDLAVDDRVTVIYKNVEDWQPTRRFDLVVANPPYIAVGDKNVQKSVHDFEPHAALYSGAEGLDAIRSWSAWAAGHLEDGGIFVCEIGTGQSPHVLDIMRNRGFVDLQVTRDLAGHDRVVSGMFKR
jgi:release factor glutamine methyltransferase